MGKLTFKPGDTFRMAGKATLNGVADFTGWSLAAAVKLIDPATGQVADAPLATATCAWLDAADGLLEVLVPAANTAGWPTGGELAVDVKLTAPDGSISTTETATFRTEKRVTP